MLVLVTGATGFLGSAVIEKLLKHKYDVIGIGRKSNGFLGKESLSHRNFKLVQFDLNNPLDNVIDGDIDVIVHLASQQPSNTMISFDNLLNGNAMVTKNLLGFAKNKKVSLFLFASTTSVFRGFPKKAFINENSLLDPINYYGLTKYIAEKIIEIELAKSTCKAAIIRFPSIFGKNHLGGIVYTFYQLAKDNKKVKIFGNGERYRNLLYVDDAVAIILKILEKKVFLSNYEVFTAGSKDSKTMHEIAILIKTFLKSNSRIELIDKLPPNDWDVFIDNGKLEETLGMKTLSIKEGLEKYLRELGHEI